MTDEQRNEEIRYFMGMFDAESSMRERVQQFPMDQLFRLCHNNPTVGHVISNWRHGGFNSLESALVFLVLELARQNEELTKRATVFFE
jgi:hypothetical protein